MSSDDIAAVLERVRTWPRERQEDLVRIALQLEEQDTAEHTLTDQQVNEVRRIRDEVRAGMIASDADMADLWKQCGL